MAASAQPASPDPSTGTRIARGVVAGLIAGITASYVMDRFQAVAGGLLPDSGGASEPATERTADAIAAATTGHDIPAVDKPLAGQVVHYVLGAGLGIAYAVAAEFRPGVTAGYGTMFGIGTATILDEAAVPALGLGTAPWRTGAPTHLYSHASHIVFGGVTELVRRSVRATLIPR